MKRRFLIVFAMAAVLLLGAAQTVSADPFFWFWYGARPTPRPTPPPVPTPVPTPAMHDLIIQFPGVDLDPIEVFVDDGPLQATSGPASNQDVITLADGVYDVVLHQGAGTQSWQNVILQGADRVLRDLVCGVSVDFDGIPVTRIAMQTAAGGDLVGEDNPANVWSSTVLKSFDPEPDVWWLALEQGPASYRQPVNLTCRYGAVAVTVDPVTLDVRLPGVHADNVQVHLCGAGGEQGALVMETGPVSDGVTFSLLPGNCYQLTITEGPLTWTSDCLCDDAIIDVPLCDLDSNFTGYSVLAARLYYQGTLVQTLGPVSDSADFSPHLPGTFDVEFDVADPVTGGTYTQRMPGIGCGGSTALNDVFCQVSVNVPLGIALDRLALSSDGVTLSTRANVSGLQAFQVLKPAFNGGLTYTIVAEDNGLIETRSGLGCGAVLDLFCALTVDYPGVTADTIRLLTGEGAVVASATNQADQWLLSAVTGAYQVEITDNTVIETYPAVCAGGVALVTDIVCPWCVEFEGVTGTVVLKETAGGPEIERVPGQTDSYCRTMLKGSYWYRVWERIPGVGSFWTPQSTGTFSCSSGQGHTSVVPICDLTVGFAGHAVADARLYNQAALLIESLGLAEDAADFGPHLGASYDVALDLGDYDQSIQDVACAAVMGLDDVICDLEIPVPAGVTLDSVSLTAPGDVLLTTVSNVTTDLSLPVLRDPLGGPYTVAVTIGAEQQSRTVSGCETIDDLECTLTVDAGDVAMTAAEIRLPGTTVAVVTAPSVVPNPWLPVIPLGVFDLWVQSATGETTVTGVSCGDTVEVECALRPEFELVDVTLDWSLEPTLSERGDVSGSWAGSDLLLLLDPANAYYYLDVDTLTTTTPLLNQTAEFLLDPTSVPAGFYAYWDAKGVNAAAAAATWQGVMWGIISGDAPILLLDHQDGATQLWDGLQAAIGQPEQPLRLSGDYPAGTYRFTGTLQGVCEGQSAVVIALTIRDPLDVEQLALRWTDDQATELALPWASESPLAGDLALGYTLEADAATPFYFLDVVDLQTNHDLASGDYEFYLDASTLPAGFADYWAARGVPGGVEPWQVAMAAIIAGDEPIAVLRVTDGSQGDHALLDGLQYALGQAQYLRVSGDYPLGAYALSGELTDVYGLSATLEVVLTVTSQELQPPT